MAADTASSSGEAPGGGAPSRVQRMAARFEAAVSSSSFKKSTAEPAPLVIPFHGGQDTVVVVEGVEGLEGLTMDEVQELWDAMELLDEGDRPREEASGTPREQEASNTPRGREASSTPRGREASGTPRAHTEETPNGGEASASAAPSGSTGGGKQAPAPGAGKDRAAPATGLDRTAGGSIGARGAKDLGTLKGREGGVSELVTKQREIVTKQRSPDGVGKPSPRGRLVQRASADSKPEQFSLNDLPVTDADVAGRRAELAKVETELEKRRGELSKVRIDIATTASEKVQLDCSLKRLQQEFKDWADALEESAHRAQATEEEERAQQSQAQGQGEPSFAVVKARLVRRGEEVEILRKREVSMQEDIEYLEAKYGGEKKETLDLKRKLSEAKGARKDAERELQRLRPEVMFVRKTAAALQRRLASEQEETRILRQQLQKAQAAELELLERVQLATRESASLRKEVLLAQEGSREGAPTSAERQLREQLLRNVELEAKCTSLGKSVVQLEMRLAGEERKRGEVQRALGELEDTRLGLEYQQSLTAAANSDALEDNSDKAQASAVSPMAAAAIPERVWSLLEQVEVTKTSGMPTADELVRLHWLTTCLREELHKAKQQAQPQGLRPAGSGSTVDGREGTPDELATAGSGGTSSGGLPPIKASIKLMHRSLSSVIKLPSEPSTDRGQAGSSKGAEGGARGAASGPGLTPLDISGANSSTVSSSASASMSRSESVDGTPREPPATPQEGVPEGSAEVGGVPPVATPRTLSKLSRWLSSRNSSEKDREKEKGTTAPAPAPATPAAADAATKGRSATPS